MLGFGAIAELAIAEFPFGVPFWVFAQQAAIIGGGLC